MSVWTGWQTDFLGQAAAPNTAATRRFLNDWHTHAESNCADNPVDLSEPVGGSHDCHALGGLVAKAQAYTTKGNATHAWDVQIHQSDSSAILAALRSGDPYTVDNTGIVSEQLSLWGSVAFGKRYLAETVNAPGRGGGGGVLSAPHALGGWKALRRSVNKSMPEALAASSKSRQAALRSLNRARKVRL